MTVYAGKFQGSAAVERYWRKLSNRLDRLRHDLECQVLSRHAGGEVFDCTIGVGRFIGVLPLVRSYHGVDISDDFVAYVRTAHPGTRAERCDLTLGISEPDDRFDTVICLRSLSAIGRLSTILPEMVRIARPSGIVIVDYGRKPTAVTLNGETVVTDDEDIEAVLSGLDADVLERVRCDAVLTRLKKRGRVFRFFTQGMGAFIPAGVLLGLERLAAPLLWERQIIILRKRDFRRV